ncbi:MAG: ATP-binding protein [Anaerolineales bacterium]|nr:ATP-binding protein [Anaerolineales bacterium]
MPKSERGPRLRTSVAAKILFAMALSIAAALATLALVAAQAAAREFQGYMLRGGEAGPGPLVELLTAYYEDRGTWEGAQRLLGAPGDHMGMMGGGMAGRGLILVDAGGVAVAGPRAILGQAFSPVQLESAVPVVLDGVTVGFIIPGPVGMTPVEQEVLGRVRQALWLAALVSGALAIVVGGLLAASILRPIRDLTSAARAIASGDLSRRVPMRSSDELGELSQSFNQMAGSLQRSEQLRREMTADVAHELRTPLAVMRARLEGIADGVYSASQDSVRSVLDQTLVLNRLVEDLGTLAMTDAKQLRLDKTPTDLRPLAARVMEGHAARAACLTVNLRLEAPIEGLTVDADPIRLEQLLGNLLTNAIRQGRPGGEVVVQLSQQAGGWAEIRVMDDGEGIPEEALPFIFERFYRTDKSRARSEGGTGLGLAIARNLVELHGGQITAANRQQGGAELVVRLPLAAGAAGRAAG